jgi:phosphoserine phosphatase RsbU/P
MITRDQTPFDKLDILHTVAQAITDATDEDHLIAQATELIGENLFPDNFGLLLMDGKNDALRVHPSYRINKKLSEEEYFVPIEQSFVGHVARTGRPERIADVRSSLNYKNFDPETRSELAVPLILGKRTIGVINAERKIPHGFSDSDERFLVILASQISTAIAHLRTVKTENRNAEVLAVLLELSQQFSQQLDIERVLAETYEVISRLLDTSNFYIALFDPENQTVSFPIHINESVRDYETLKIITPTEGLTGHILQTKMPILIKENPRDWEKQNNVKISGEIAASWLGVPLLARNNIVGVIAVQDYKHANVYDEHDLEIMTAIASQAATAIENARLFDNTQKRLREQTILRKAAEILSSTLDIETILTQLTK